LRRLSPGDVRPEHIEAVVVTDNVVKLLWFDALRNVDVLIEQSFGIALSVMSAFGGKANIEVTRFNFH
jgi:hypothetical protein